MNIISNISLSIGADETKKWYCKKCNECYEQKKPQVCNEEILRFSDIKQREWFRKVYKDCNESECKMTDEEIDNYLSIPEMGDYYREIGKYSEHEIDFYDVVGNCGSKKFVYKKSEGLVVDSYDSNFLSFWGSFAKKN